MEWYVKIPFNRSEAFTVFRLFVLVHNIICAAFFYLFLELSSVVHSAMGNLNDFKSITSHTSTNLVQKI